MEHIQRIEMKYLISRATAACLYQVLRRYMKRDAYGQSTICNVYYDTPDCRLIRYSIEKPAYKEKVRLRSYGVPESADDKVYVELKKKSAGTVFKRRIALPLGDATKLLAGHDVAVSRADTQIKNEIRWVVDFYRELQPALAICYNRLSLFGIEDESLRVTFDAGIAWRGTHLDLTAGTAGRKLIDDDTMLLEIKAPQTMPVWLADALSALFIYPSSFSKYGTCYQQLRNPLIEIGAYQYVGKCV